MKPVCCNRTMHLYPSGDRYVIRCRICGHWWDMNKQQAFKKGYEISTNTGKVLNNDNNIT